jgi:FAD:protein FMN transferase
MRPAAIAALLFLATLAEAAEVRIGQPVMGTVLQVTVVAADEALARSLAESCVREARRWDDVLTTWRAEGELAQLNRYAGRGGFEVSPSLAAALRRMTALSKATGGAFDPSVGSWVDWWRTPHRAPPRGRSTPPPMAKALRLDGRVARLARGVVLDAGGIGKGIALDSMVDLLRKGHAAAAFLDFGGSGLYGVGAPADSPEGWPVALSGLGDSTLLGVVHLRDGSLSTSRSSGPGDAAGPIIDPRTGRPVEGPRLATVLSADATLADAWSTALIVRGGAGIEEAAKAGLPAILVDPQGVQATPQWTKKVGDHS